MNFKDKHILILAPHTDDGELGCGGTISRAIREGAKVTYIAFSTAEESLPEGFPENQLSLEVQEATKRIGIKSENVIIYNHYVRKLNYVRQEILEELIKIRNSIKPDIVFLPAQNDIHQDHSTINKEGIRAFKNISILGYELVWNNLTFESDCFIQISELDLQNKCNALDCYISQKGRDYMSEEFHRSLATVRGVQIGVPLAESFQVIRWIIP